MSAAEEAPRSLCALTLDQLHSLRVEQLRSCLRIVGLRTTYKLKSELGSRLLDQINAFPSAQASRDAARLAEQLHATNTQRAAAEQQHKLKVHLRKVPKTTAKKSSPRPAAAALAASGAASGQGAQHLGPTAGGVHKKQQKQRTPGWGIPRTVAGGKQAHRQQQQQQHDSHTDLHTPAQRAGTAHQSSAASPRLAPDPFSYQQQLQQQQQQQQQQQEEEEQAYAAAAAAAFHAGSSGAGLRKVPAGQVFQVTPTLLPAFTPAADAAAKPPAFPPATSGPADGTAHHSTASQGLSSVPAGTGSAAAAAGLLQLSGPPKYGTVAAPAGPFAAAPTPELSAPARPALPSAAAAGAGVVPFQWNPAMLAFSLGSPSLSQTAGITTNPQNGLAFRCPCGGTSPRIGSASGNTPDKSADQQQQPQPELTFCRVCAILQHAACFGAPTNAALGTAGSTPGGSGHMCDICRLVAAAGMNSYRLQSPLLMAPRLLTPCGDAAFGAAAAAATQEQQKVAADAGVSSTAKWFVGSFSVPSGLTSVLSTAAAIAGSGGQDVCQQQQQEQQQQAGVGLFVGCLQLDDSNISASGSDWQSFTFTWPSCSSLIINGREVQLPAAAGASGSSRSLGLGAAAAPATAAAGGGGIGVCSGGGGLVSISHVARLGNNDMAVACNDPGCFVVFVAAAASSSTSSSRVVSIHALQQGLLPGNTPGFAPITPAAAPNTNQYNSATVTATATASAQQQEQPEQRSSAPRLQYAAPAPGAAPDYWGYPGTSSAAEAAAAARAAGAGGVASSGMQITDAEIDMFAASMASAFDSPPVADARAPAAAAEGGTGGVAAAQDVLWQLFPSAPHLTRLQTAALPGLPLQLQEWAEQQSRPASGAVGEADAGLGRQAADMLMSPVANSADSFLQMVGHMPYLMTPYGSAAAAAAAGGAVSLLQANHYQQQQQQASVREQQEDSGSCQRSAGPADGPTAAAAAAAAAAAPAGAASSGGTPFAPMAAQPSSSSPGPQNSSSSNDGDEDFAGHSMSDLSMQLVSLSLLEPGATADRLDSGALWQQLPGGYEGFWSPGPVRGQHYRGTGSAAAGGGAGTPQSRGQHSLGMSIDLAELLATPPANRLASAGTGGRGGVGGVSVFSPFWRQGGGVGAAGGATGGGGGGGAGVAVDETAGLEGSGPAVMGLLGGSFVSLTSLQQQQQQEQQQQEQQYLPLAMLPPAGTNRNGSSSSSRAGAGQPGTGAPVGAAAQAQQGSGGNGNERGSGRMQQGGQMLPPAAAAAAAQQQQQQQQQQQRQLQQQQRRSSSANLFEAFNMEVSGPNLISTGGVLSSSGHLIQGGAAPGGTQAVTGGAGGQAPEGGGSAGPWWEQSGRGLVGGNSGGGGQMGPPRAVGPRQQQQQQGGSQYVQDL